MATCNIELQRNGRIEEEDESKKKQKKKKNTISEEESRAQVTNLLSELMICNVISKVKWIKFDNEEV